MKLFVYYCEYCVAYTSHKLLGMNKRVPPDVHIDVMCWACKGKPFVVSYPGMFSGPTTANATRIPIKLNDIPGATELL